MNIRIVQEPDNSSRIRELIRKIIVRGSILLIRPIEGIFVGYYMKCMFHILLFSGIKMKGKPKFIAHSVKFDNPHLITLGSDVVLTNKVFFLTHDYSFTTGLVAIGKRTVKDICLHKNIEVGNNVFIGMNSFILPGTKIEDNIIIGAGSIVHGILKANGVYAGNPAKYICGIEQYIEKYESFLSSYK